MDAYQAFTSESKCVYPPVDPNLRQIRLVTIEPGNWPDEIKGSLHTFSLREQPAYEALSYVWGDPTHRKPIQLNSQIVEVTENLWTALRRLRKPSAPRVLWIDALCINQGDAEDKFSQVALMGEIFMGCAAAVLWLGEDPEVAETGSESTVGCRVSELLHTFQIEQHMFELPCFLGGERSDVKEDYKPHFEDLRMLLELPWWKRIWVVQEMVLPPQIQFMYGSEQFPYSEFLSLAEYLRQHAVCCSHYRERLPALGFDPLMLFEEQVEPMISVRRRWRDPGESFTLLELRRLFSASEASVLQGLFYALLGIVNKSGTGIPLRLDYRLSSTDDIIGTVYSCMVDYGGVALLQGERIDHDRTTGLPSWLPDLCVGSTPSRRVWGEQQRLKIAQRFSATGTCHQDKTRFRLIEGRALSLQALMVDKIVCIGDAMDPLDEFDKFPVSLVQWMGMIDMGIDDWPKEPPAQGSQQDSFWRTILNDSIPVAKEGGTAYIQPTDGHYRELHKLWKTLQVLLPFVGPTVKNEVENFARPWMVMDLVFSWSLIAYHVVVCLWQRRMFITEKGFVGLASKSVRAGDEVHILLGSPVPFILRPCRGAETYRTGDAQERLPTYTVVGNGYLHGIMFGEALEGNGKDKVESIALY